MAPRHAGPGLGPGRRGPASSRQGQRGMERLVQAPSGKDAGARRRPQRGRADGQRGSSLRLTDPRGSWLRCRQRRCNDGEAPSDRRQEPGDSGETPRRPPNASPALLHQDGAGPRGRGSWFAEGVGVHACPWPGCVSAAVTPVSPHPPSRCRKPVCPHIAGRRENSAWPWPWPWAGRRGCCSQPRLASPVTPANPRSSGSPVSSGLKLARLPHQHGPQVHLRGECGCGFSRPHRPPSGQQARLLRCLWDRGARSHRALRVSRVCALGHRWAGAGMQNVPDTWRH